MAGFHRQHKALTLTATGIARELHPFPFSPTKTFFEEMADTLCELFNFDITMISQYILKINTKSDRIFKKEKSILKHKKNIDIYSTYVVS